MKKTAGFSLIELMIAVALVGVFASLAVPAFRDLVLNNRQTAQLNDLVSSLNYARTEAIRRGNQVTVCSTGTPVCQAKANCKCDGGANWHTGWIVFDNPGGDPDPVTVPDDVLNVYQGFEGDSELKSAGQARFDFAPSGFRADADNPAANDVTLVLCDGRPPTTHAAELVVKLSGRPQTSREGSASCTPS